MLKKNVFQILAIIDFSSGEITGETLSVRENIIGNINSDRTSRLNSENLASATFLIADRHHSYKLKACSPRPRPDFTLRLHQGVNTNYRF